MKYIVAILLAVGAYIWGRTDAYREVVSCADATSKEASYKEVFDFYGHRTYDIRHHQAFAYWKTLRCMLTKERLR